MCRIFQALPLSFVVAVAVVSATASAQDADPPEDPHVTRLRQRAHARAAEASEQAWLAKLRAKLAEDTVMEFVEVPLTDVVAYLCDLHSMPIHIESKALAGAGIATDTPVTRNLRGISLRSALRLLLRELELTYVLRDEVLLITTRETAAKSFSIEQYAVDDLCNDKVTAQSIAEAVRQLILPPQPSADKTDKTPSGSRIAVVGDVLVVKANPTEHEVIEKMLERLRAQPSHRTNSPHPLQGWKPGPRVSLAYIPLQADDLRPLAGHAIESLDLSSTGLGDLGVLGELKSLKHLNLSKCRLSDQSLSGLAKLPALAALDLSGNSQLTDAGLRHLAALPLVSLALANTQVATCGELAKLSSLRELDLSDTRIVDDSLGSLPRVHKMNLNGTRISDAGLKRLILRTDLEYLQLPISGAPDSPQKPLLTATAVTELREKLPKCHIVSKLATDFAIGPAANAADPFGTPPARDPFGAPQDDPFK